MTFVRQLTSKQLWVWRDRRQSCSLSWDEIHNLKTFRLVTHTHTHTHTNDGCRFCGGGWKMEGCHWLSHWLLTLWWHSCAANDNYVYPWCSKKSAKFHTEMSSHCWGNAEDLFAAPCACSCWKDKQTFYKNSCQKYSCWQCLWLFLGELEIVAFSWFLSPFV